VIDLDFIQRLIQAIDASGLDSIEIERAGTRIKLSKTPPPAAAPAYAMAPQAAMPMQPPAQAAGGAAGAASAAAAEAPKPPTPSTNLVDIKSPMVGTFYQAPAPDAPAYVEVGKRIKKGDTLCIIEAMKLMNEMEAEVAGTIVEVLAGNGEPVEYGQVLFRVDPS
jgi:acetyl-CoA carboxylase biotin carboxyl carrier protein